MNAKIVSAVIAIVALGGLGVWWMSRTPAQESAVESGSASNAEETREENAGRVKSSFNELFTNGGKQKCTYAFTEKQGSLSGTVYFDGEQHMRGDFTTAAEGAGTFDSHMIREGDWMYSWGGPFGAEMGTKINIAAQAETQNRQQNEAMNFDERFDFDCDPWSVDRSKFELPKNVAFSEISTQFNSSVDTSAGTGTGSTQQNQCSACNALPEGEARSQCLQALGC